MQRLPRQRSANAVMDVDHGKHDAQLVPLLEQAAQQGYGVGAPGDRDGDPLAGTKETVRRVGGGIAVPSQPRVKHLHRYRAITELA